MSSTSMRNKPNQGLFANKTMRNAISREHLSQFILLVICYLGRIYENMRNKYFISIAGKSFRLSHIPRSNKRILIHNDKTIILYTKDNDS